MAATTVSPQIDTDPVTQQSLEIELTEPNLVRAVPQVSAGSLRNVWIAAGSAVLLLALLGLATRVFHIRPEGITRAGDHGQTNDVAAGKKATPEEKNVVVVAPMNPPIAPVTVSTTSGSPPRTPDTPVPVMVPQSKSSSPSKGGSLPAQFPQRPQVAAQNGLRTQRVTPVAPTVDFAAERKAAEWLVSIGGQFIMVGESGGICKLVNGALPPERFSLQSVDLTNNPRLTDAGLANLAVCRRLAQLTLKGNDNITDEALTQLQRLLSLSDLRIEECPKLTGSVLRKLSQLENLRDLTMPMIDADVHWISPPLQLRSLNVSVTSLTDRGLEELARCQPGLERLILDSRGTATLHALAHFRNLQSVLFSESQLNAETARVLAGIPTLRRIDSWGGPPVAGTFQRMSVIKQLQELRFYNATPLEYPITDADFNSLLQLPALTYLQFEGVSPSDIALQKLAGIASLQTLMVVVMRTEFRRYSPAGIAKFRELRPDVRFMIDGKYQPVSPK
ncbi:MAG: F-box/LRR-repeat protein 20 [Planctomycetaceae bacterium]|nr:F-box/LRR-repeat protein 20 [Planctomycetaceae bacterium]